MGREAICSVRVDGEGAEAKVLLETEELIVRAPLRVTIPFRAVEHIAVDGDTLRLRTAAHDVEIDLGAKAAAAWAGRIANPKGRLDKLGIKAGQRVSVVGVIDDPTFTAELAQRGVDVATRARSGSDAIFLGARTRADLRRVATMKRSLASNGALWVVRPKGVTTISEAQVMEAGREAGLVDTKVVKFSESLTAEKFVIPVADR